MVYHILISNRRDAGHARDKMWGKLMSQMIFPNIFWRPYVDSGEYQKISWGLKISKPTN